MSRIALAEALKPGSPVLNPEANNLLLDLYSETLEEIGPERFDAAFREVMKSSPYRPDISEIRKAAGLNRGIVDPVKAEAERALNTVFAAMRKHGCKLPVKPGEIIRTKDEHGLWLAGAGERGPDEAAPRFDERTEWAIIALGYGSREKGLELLADHPAVCPAKPGSTMVDARYRQGVAEAIERRWVEAWRA